jgi:hypothetical protein
MLGCSPFPLSLPPKRVGSHLKVIHRQQGKITLMELMIAWVVSAVAFAAMYSMLQSQSDVYRVQDQVVEMEQTARTLMTMLTRDVRMAGYKPVQGAVFDGVTYNPGQLRIRADLNGNGTTTEANEDVIYIYNPATFEVLRSTGAAQIRFNHVQAFTFSYLDAAGNPTTTTANIRQVEVTVTTRTSTPDKNYPVNMGYRTVTLRSKVTPRNLGL